MITTDMYKTTLMTKGKNLSQVRKYNSALVMNATFTGDTGYKKVYILDKEKGWIYEDVKYSKHATPSILKDAVDYYLQFRPKVHYPVGSYVFIPNDEENEIGFDIDEPSDPFQDENFDSNKLWLIVDRNDAVEFVRYNIIKCNWNFKWMTRVNGEYKVLNIWGCIRNANSYTSGVWAADYSTQLDNITSAWIPDTYLLYNDMLSDYNLCDTRYLKHEQRFMLTHNKIDPKVYTITKVQDLIPQGIIKLTLKQDELNEVTDNVELMICNYYSESGEILIKPQTHTDYLKVSLLWSAQLNDKGELLTNLDLNPILHLATTSYYNVEFFYRDVPQKATAEWRISYAGISELTDKEKEHLCNLLVMRQIDNSVISIRPSKSNKLIGEKFLLTVQDANGDYTTSVELEVQ